MSWYLGMRNPSRDWKCDPGREVVFDLKSRTLSGVEVGAHIEKLSFLGTGLLRRALPAPRRRIPALLHQVLVACFKSDYWNTRLPHLEYPQLGVRIYFDARDRIVGFEVMLDTFLGAASVHHC